MRRANRQEKYLWTHGGGRVTLEVAKDAANDIFNLSRKLQVVNSVLLNRHSVPVCMATKNKLV